MKEKILTILEENRGKSVSGGKMADTLGVTRAAVNKAVASLRAQGYQIEAVTGRGYRLARECDRLSAPGIRRWLKKDRDRTILIYDEVASTNLDGKRGFAGMRRRRARACTASEHGAGTDGQKLLFPAGHGGIYDDRDCTRRGRRSRRFSSRWRRQSPSHGRSIRCMGSRRKLNGSTTSIMRGKRFAGY